MGTRSMEIKVVEKDMKKSKEELDELYISMENTKNFNTFRKAKSSNHPTPLVRIV